MAFNLANTFSQSKKPTSTQTWTRPGDWPTITDSPGKWQALVSNALFSKYEIKTAFVAPSGQNLYVDWGDGTIDTITTPAETFTTHTYSTGGTPCSRGYDTWVVQVYTDAGGTVLCPSFMPDGGDGDPFGTRGVGVLEVVFGDDIEFDTSGANPSSAIGPMRPFLLEYVKLPATMVTNGSPDFIISSSYCYSLAKVVMPISAPNTTNYANAFTSCFNLLGEIVIPQDSLGITSMSAAFQNCTNVTSVILPPTMSSCTNFISAFNTTGIRSIVIPSNPCSANWSSAFSNSRFLTYIKFEELTTTGNIDWGQLCNGCSSLMSFVMPASAPTGQVLILGSNTFNTCVSLQSLTFPANVDTNISGTVFQNLYNLLSVTWQSNAPSISSFTSMFSGCFALQSVTLPSVITAGAISMSAAFQNCRSLSTITIPSAWNLGTMANTFQNCVGLKTAYLPNNSQNNITFMTSTFNTCTSLTSVVMPTSLTGVTTMANAFQNCFSLQSLTLPSTMNACTTMTSAFSGCSALQSITLPTSMTAMTTTGLASIFSACYSLRNVVMPATVAATISSYLNAFQNSGVSTVTLPTTQTTSVATIQNMFTGCYNLKTVTNMDKIGNTATNGTIVTAQTFANLSPNLTSVTLACRLSKLELQSVGSQPPSALASVRLTNTGTGQWTGTSPQIDVSTTGLSTAALNTLFADMAAQGNVVSKTINITNATGAAGLTAADRLVITSKGWTITG